jgi:molybdopterin-guanine dinucleotide biosynthesis protein A
MTRNTSNITLAILAGGEGSRMGVPKGELAIKGKPILEYLLDRFDWPGPTMLVTAPGREHPSAWKKFSREVVDPVAGEGPLRGLLTALENAPTEVVVIATVDMPFVERSHLEWMVDQLRDSMGVMSSHGDRVEPFPSAFSTNAVDAIREHLARNGGVYQLSKLDGFDLVAAPNEWRTEVWTNLNIPNDLRDLL